MGKLDGFKASKEDSLIKRSASALIWLRKQPGGETRFISWSELYAALIGVDVDLVDPEEVKQRLRTKAYYMKAFMRESGYGWTVHPADRSLIRATAPGGDSRLCSMYYHRRAARASENFVDWTEETVGDISRIQRTKENAAELAMIAAAMPRHRAIVAALGSIVKIESKRKPVKHAASHKSKAKAAA